MDQWLGEVWAWLAGDTPLVADLRSALVSVLVATAASYVVFSSRRRSFRAFWGFNRKGGKIRVVMAKHSDHPHPRGYSYSTVAAGDAEAASLVTSSMSVAYADRYQIRALPSNHFNDDFWREPVILVGGGTRNQPANAFLASLAEAYRLEFSIDDQNPAVERSVVDEGNSKRFTARLPQGAPDGSGQHFDWAVITKGPNMSTRHANDPHVLFYGLHAFGTLGAAQIVSSTRMAQFRKVVVAKLSQHSSPVGKLLLLFRVPRFVQILVRVQILRDDVLSEVVDARVLRRRKK
ncbi:MAG: hypothetical protein Q8S20_06005 [Sulfuritalea sp.]|nr:hypothetical protein [Sulfuritalea sp.]